MKLFSQVMLCSLCFFLSGCQKEESTAYFLTHLDYLKTELDTCEAASVSDQNATPYCKHVLSTAATFTELLKDQQSDQQAFGEKMLRLETFFYARCATASSKIAISKTCDDAKEKIQFMSAVLSMSAPE